MGIINEWQKLRQRISAMCAFIAVYGMSSSLVYGQEEADPTELLTSVTAWFGEVMQFVLVVITILSFVVAAWAAIQVVSALISRKAEVGGVFMILIVAIFATIFVGQMALEGSEKITELTGG